MRFSRLPLCAALAIAPVFAAVPSSADDSDDKVYAAFGCQEEGTDTGAFHRSQYRITRTSNTGTGRILCPIIRDKVGSCGAGYDTEGGWFGDVYTCAVRVHVNTYRTTNSGDLSCSLFVRNYTGTAIEYRTKYADPGHDTLEISTPTQTYDNGYYHLSCALPANTSSTYTKIYSYKVFE